MNWLSVKISVIVNIVPTTQIKAIDSKWRHTVVSFVHVFDH